MKASSQPYYLGAVVAALTLISLSPNAKAVLDLGGYLGPVTFNVRSLDNGAVYDINQATGNLSNGANFATGAGNLNALTQAAPYNSQGFDTWGIFQVTAIAGTSGDVYNSSASNFKLWGVFEATDIAIQTNLGSGGSFLQNVASSGLSIGIYAIPDGVNVFNIAPGDPFTQVPSSNHTAPGVFTNITTLGTLELSLVGHAGVLGANTSIGPNPGGASTELLTAFDPVANTSDGVAFLDVRTGGGPIGASNFLFNSNGFSGGSDLQLQFNASQTVNWFTFQNPNTTSNWLIGDSDPAQAVVIPEPTTALTGFGLMLPLFGSLMGRRKRK